jgi:hypothetical protein
MSFHETPTTDELGAELEKAARRIKINRMARQQDAAENWRPPPPEPVSRQRQLSL